MSSPSHSVFTPIRFEPESLIPSPNDSGLGPTKGFSERETMNRNDSSPPNGAEVLVQSSAKPALIMPANGAETAALPALGQDATGRFQELDFAGLQTGSAPVMDWVWKGYIAGGNVTLLISQWKSGKSTLMSVLLSKLGGQETGGSMGGHAISAGRAVVVTEEPKEAWHQRSLVLPLGDGFASRFWGRRATRIGRRCWIKLAAFTSAGKSTPCSSIRWPIYRRCGVKTKRGRC